MSLPNKLPGGGVLPRTINQLIEHLKTLTPQSSPNVLTGHTTRGVTRKPKPGSGDHNSKRGPARWA